MPDPIDPSNEELKTSFTPSHRRTTRESRYNKRDGKSKKISQSLRARSASTSVPDIRHIPFDGVYSAELLCEILSITRQALSYHTKKANKVKRLYYVKRAGDHMHYITAVEFYRFLLVNQFSIPSTVLTAVVNYNYAYGETEWLEFKRCYESSTSGTFQAGEVTAYNPPEQAAPIKPAIAPGTSPKPFDPSAPKIPLSASPLSSGNHDSLTEMLQ